MKESLIKLLLLLAFLLQMTKLSAQTYIGAMPMVYNPSTAGNSDKLRISTYHNYRSFIITNTLTNTISIDNYFSKIASGVGLTFLTQQVSDEYVKTSIHYGELAYSPKIN